MRASCGRCAKRSTTTEKFTYKGDTYRIELCDDCVANFQRDLYMWGRCGTVLMDQAALIGEFARSYARRDRSRQERDRPPELDEAELIAPEVGDPRMIGRWHLSDHANGRLEERGAISGFDRDDVLLAVEAGAIYSYREGQERRVRSGVIVVVDPDDKEIITIMTDDEQEKIGA